MSPRKPQTSELDSDIHIMEQRLLQHTMAGMDCTIDVVTNIAEYCDGDAQMQKEMESIMADFVRMDEEVKQLVTALNHTKSQSEKLDDDVSLRSVFDEKLDKLKTKKSHGPAAHPKYKAMLDEFEKGGSIVEQLESLKSTLLGETEDDDVALTQAEVNIRCPYTGMDMTDPVRNKHCGHVYDREGILGHIKAKKDKAKCPVGGCGNQKPLKPDHMEEYKEMKRYITLLNKQRS